MQRLYAVGGIASTLTRPVIGRRQQCLKNQSPNAYHQSMTHTTKVFDLFWRNPYNYWREMKQIGETDIAWDRGVVTKMRIDPFKFSSFKFTDISPNWRFYIIGTYDAQEYDATCSTDKPLASYPTFDWVRDGIDVLEYYLKNPWGEDKSVYNDSGIPVKERAVKGQAHKIFVTNLPRADMYDGVRAYSTLQEIAENWEPYGVQIVIHRSYSMANLFGRSFSAGTADGREQASHGRIQLYNGKVVDPRYADPHILRPYLNQFGFEYDDMQIAGNRCMFNMKSLRYGSNNWKIPSRPFKRMPRQGLPDIVSPDGLVRIDAPKGITLPGRSSRAIK